MKQLGGKDVVLEDWTVTNTRLNYSHGVVTIQTEDHHPWGVDHWLNYLQQSNVEGLCLDNINDRVMAELSSNVKTVYVKDKSHLLQVKGWLTGEFHNHSLADVTVEYVGPYSAHNLEIEKVSKSVTALHLPLSTNIHTVLRVNPHLKSIGIDLDNYAGVLPGNVSVALWSCNEYRVVHAQSIHDSVVKVSLFPKNIGR